MYFSKWKEPFKGDIFKVPWVPPSEAKCDGVMTPQHHVFKEIRGQTRAALIDVLAEVCGERGFNVTPTSVQILSGVDEHTFRCVEDKDCRFFVRYRSCKNGFMFSEAY